MIDEVGRDGDGEVKRFRKPFCPIVEFLVCSVMMHSRNNAKKMMTVRIVNHAFKIIHLLTDKTFLQVCVGAVKNKAPREKPTHVGSAGSFRR